MRKAYDNLSNELTLQNHLKSQLNDLKLTISEKKIAQFIIQSLEENGLLKMDLDEIEELMGFTYSIKEIKSVLNHIIQNIEPAGIGARDFKETIFIQLKRQEIPSEELEVANKILFDPQFFNFEDAKDKLQVHYSKSIIENVLKKIKQCDLSPGLGFELIWYVIRSDVIKLPFFLSFAFPIKSIVLFELILFS